MEIETEDEDGSNLDRIGQMITDLIMWRDVAKSSLWFGFGTLCFFSSCFAKGINFRCVFFFLFLYLSLSLSLFKNLRPFKCHNFSIFSVISQLGLLFLGASFLSNSISQRLKLKLLYHIMFQCMFLCVKF